MRPVFAAVVMLLGVQAPSPTGAPRTPVLVELYTSEGCSSCPSADHLLSTFVHDQPIAGVQVIGLGLHVHYWDDLGWKDDASFHGATVRQQRYASALSTNLYTPEAVIDGREGVVGSDRNAL